ncbi:MAG: VOC family protein [Chthonomonadales bacterium]
MKTAEFKSLAPHTPAGPDIAAAIKFYTTEMGFEVVWKNDTMAQVKRGTVIFNLMQNDNKVWADNTSFSIGVDDLDALYEEYKGISARVGKLEVKFWGRREFHMVVESGVCLQFFQVEPE